ncbi:hypothetical protein ACWEOW_19660 [Monashia sp. NPDC004114]
MPRVVQTQRTATLKHLRDLTRLKSRAEDSSDEGVAPRDIAWLLVLENLLFAAEAEVRWLDHVESTLARHGSLHGPFGMPAGDVTEDDDLRDAARSHSAAGAGSGREGRS